MEYILLALFVAGVVVFLFTNGRELVKAPQTSQEESDNTSLREERAVLGESLYHALKGAAAERENDKAFGVYISVIRNNGQNFSVLYGFTEKSGRKIPHHEAGGQFNISLVSSEDPFSSIFGKYGEHKKYADFEEFLRDALAHVKNVD